MEKLVLHAQELFHIHLTGRQVMALITYERELPRLDQKFNLTAIRDTESIRTKTFFGFISCVLAWGANPHIVSLMWAPGGGFSRPASQDSLSGYEADPGGVGRQEGHVLRAYGSHARSREC